MCARSRAAWENIYRELQTDLGLPAPTTGDLTPWADRGVLLLNRVLTVRPGASASHRGKGWEEVTECAIDALVVRGGPLSWRSCGAGRAQPPPRLGATAAIERAPLAAVGALRLLRLAALLARQCGTSSPRAPSRWTGPCRDRTLAGGRADSFPARCHNPVMRRGRFPYANKDCRQRAGKPTTDGTAV